MTVGYANIFPLEKADERSCRLDLYTVSHSGLYIQVSHADEQPFYLYFADVRYFSGPTSWPGAGFHLVEKPAEHLKELEAMGCFNKWPEEHLLKWAQIYVVDTPDFSVKIVAAEVEKTDYSGFLKSPEHTDHTYPTFPGRGLTLSNISDSERGEG